METIYATEVKVFNEPPMQMNLYFCTFRLRFSKCQTQVAFSARRTEINDEYHWPTVFNVANNMSTLLRDLSFLNSLGLGSRGRDWGRELVWLTFTSSSNTRAKVSRNYNRFFGGTVKTNSNQRGREATLLSDLSGRKMGRGKDISSLFFEHASSSLLA